MKGLRLKEGMALEMRLKELFNQYFYGRSGQKDYTENDLPQNRIQLFFQMAWSRAGELCKVNLLYLLCCFPAILWSVTNILVVANGIERNDFFVFLFYDVLPRYLIGLIPLVVITGPFNIAVNYVLRNWARDEHAYLLTDFKDALKGNWKRGLLFGVMNGIVIILAFGCGRFYFAMTQKSSLFFVPLAVVGILFILWSLCAMILPMMIATYGQRFSQILRNAALIVFVELPKAAVIRILRLAPVIVAVVLATLIPEYANWFFSILFALYAVIAMALSKFIAVSYANYACEKYLNIKIPGAKTDIGIHRKK